jgi:hypothetical protein
MRAASVAALICAVFVLSATVVIAKRNPSKTIGIYAIVDKVVFEPDEKSPERIRIWGVFVVPVPMSSGHYKEPQRGYLYFRIAPGMEQAPKREWGELKAVAGTGQGIGFTQYWVANPADPLGNPHHSLEVQVHLNGDEAEPDIYPMPHPRGIVRSADEVAPEIDPDYESIMARLHKAWR